MCDNMKGIMLSEVSDKQKDKYLMISLTCGIKKNQNTKQTNRFLLD